MSNKKFAIVSLLLIGIVLASCATPTPSTVKETEEVEETQIVEATAEPMEEPMEYSIIHVPKLVGIGYFDSCYDGMAEAAAELGNVNLSEEATIEADAAKQSELIDTLIAREPDALLVSANDADALVPVLQRAADAGIVVVTYDADVQPEGRDFFVNMVDCPGMGQALIDQVADEVGEDAKYAYISTSPTAPNQSCWVENGTGYQETTYPDMEQLDLRYGEDDAAETRAQAEELISAYPELQMIIAPTAAGCPGAADAIKATDSVGKVHLTCLATPNTMREFIKEGTLESIYLWNTVDLGYLAMYTAVAVLEGDLTADSASLSAGRLGDYDIAADGIIVLGPGFKFDASNIDDFDF